MLEDFVRKKHSYLYFIMLGVFALIVFVIQSATDVLPRFFGVFALPTLALVISVGFFNSQLTAFLIGLLTGAMADAVFDKLVGFNTILFALIGLAASLLAEFFINRKFLPCLVTSIIITFSYYLIYWIFFEFDQGLYYLFRISLFQTVFTWLFFIPFYYFFKFWSRKLLK